MYLTRKNADANLRALAKILGFGAIPPDIIEFIENPYYLGNSIEVFPFWKDKLREIFPTPIHTRYPIISLNCAIGTGKSTITKVMEMYMECRLDHLDKIDMLGIGRVLTKPICSYFFHTSNDKARSEFEYSIKEMKSKSAYFQKGMRHPDRWVHYVADSTRTNAAVGRDLLFLAFSEVNFTDYTKTYDKIESGLQRFENRFRNAKSFIGNVVLDSSPGSTSSVSVDFIKNNSELDIYTLYAPIWDAHKHKNQFFKKGSFKVYLGDSNYDPFIISEDRPLMNDMDSDNVIECPEELRRDFKSDIHKAIQNLAGISTDSTGSFFKSKDRITECMKLPMYCKDTITYDMYDPEDRLMDYLKTAVTKLIPEDKTLFIGIDLGIVNDHTGFSIGYFDEYIYPVPGNKKSKLPTYVIPIAISIDRFPGQETSITKLTEFILELSKDYSVGCVTTDSYQNRNLLQDIKVAGIKTDYISNDKNNTSYNYLKTCIYNNHIKLPQNKRLESELKNLQFINNKVDHPSDGCFTSDTMILVRDRLTNRVLETEIINVVTNISRYDVMAYDILDNVPYWTGVKCASLTKYVSELVELHYSSGDVYQCTPDHLFLVGNEYIPAKYLEINDQLTHKYIVECRKEVPVYDIEVEGKNPNFTLSNGVVVHNSKDIADSVAGVTLCMFNNLKLAEEPSSSNLGERTRELISRLSERKSQIKCKDIEKDLVTNILKNIY